MRLHLTNHDLAVIAAALRHVQGHTRDVVTLVAIEEALEHVERLQHRRALWTETSRRYRARRKEARSA